MPELSTPNSTESPDLASAWSCSHTSPTPSPRIGTNPGDDVALSLRCSVSDDAAHPDDEAIGMAFFFVLAGVWTPSHRRSEQQCGRVFGAPSPPTHEKNFAKTQTKYVKFVVEEDRQTGVVRADLSPASDDSRM